MSYASAAEFDASAYGQARRRPRPSVIEMRINPGRSCLLQAETALGANGTQVARRCGSLVARSAALALVLWALLAAPGVLTERSSAGAHSLVLAHR